MLVRFRSPERDRESDTKRRARLREALLKAKDAATEDGSQSPRAEGHAENLELALYQRLLAKLDGS